ncbi:hypothetical protein K2X33_14275 [bacterium]|nr:hypothetical protein [bacterium]
MKADRFLLGVFVVVAAAAVYQGAGLPSSEWGPRLASLTALASTPAPKPYEPQSFLEAFCEAPSAAVCDGLGATGLEKAESELSEKLNEEALANVARGLGVAVPFSSGKIYADMAMVAHQAGIAPSEADVLFTEELERLLTERLGFSPSQEQAMVSTLRSALTDAVNYQGDVQPDTTDWKALAERASQPVAFLSASEFLRKGGPVKPIKGFCGKSLERYNAFFYQGKTGDRLEAVVLCPGVSLRALAAREQGRYTPDFAKQATYSLLSHELAHPIDARKHPQAYNNWMGCARQAASENSTLPVTPRKLSELSADQWSAETLAMLVEQGKVSREEVAGILAFGSLNYCLMPERKNGTHPDGRFRIDFKGRNPRLRQALGCAPLPPTTLSCGVEGSTL